MSDLRLAESARRQRELYHSAERVLMAHAAPYWRGRRKTLRRIIRGYLRPRRRDRTFLEWVLQSAVHAAVLALLILSLHAQPAQASCPYLELTGSLNPLNFDTGNSSQPVFVDIDDDGDLDAFVGDSGGTVKFYQNQGTASQPNMSEQTGGSNPLNAVSVNSSFAALTFADLDNDGDEDAIVGAYSGDFEYWENQGTAASPNFVQQTGASNPLDSENVGQFAKPTAVDIDDDGDFDVFSGAQDGTIFYFENTGTIASPTFVEQTGASNPFDGVNVGNYSVPVFADLDGDGDQDALIGEYNQIINFYENQGTASSPSFSDQTSGSEFEGLGLMRNNRSTTPAIADIDGDGDLDVFTGSKYGVIIYFESGKNNTTPYFCEERGSANPFDGVDVGDNAAPRFGDLDGDGDFDAVVSEQGTAFKYYLNTGSASSATFTLQSGAGPDPFNGETSGNYAVPALGDLDADGDLDALAGQSFGTFQYFQNAGSATAPDFNELTGGSNPLNGEDVGAHSTPTFVDIDGDGDKDMFSGEGASNPVNFFRNSGTASSPVFGPVTGASNPLNSMPTCSYAAPTFGDIDGDGDFDAFVGGNRAIVSFFENTGTASAPVFSDQTSNKNTLHVGFCGGASYYVKPTLVDIDNDGDLDIFAGVYDGTIRFFRYVGFVPPTLMAFNGATAASTSPTLDWSDIGQATSYTLEYADNTGFTNSTTVTGLTPSTFSFSAPLADGTYFWRVKSVRPSGESVFSGTDSFVIIPTFARWVLLGLAAVMSLIAWMKVVRASGSSPA